MTQQESDWLKFKERCPYKFPFNDNLCNKSEWLMGICSVHKCPLMRKEFVGVIQNNWVCKTTTVFENSKTEVVYRDEFPKNKKVIEILNHILACKTGVKQVELKDKKSDSYGY